MIQGCRDNNSIKKNIVYSTVYQIFTVITPLITAPYSARVLGTEGVGVQSYTTAVQAYFLLIAVLGTVGYGTREISRRRDNKYEYSKCFWEIEILTLITSFISFIGWSILCIYGVKYRKFYLVLMPNIFATAFDISWLYAGLEKFKVTLSRNIITKIIGIVLLFGLVRSSNDLIIYMMITSIINMLGSFALWIEIPYVVNKPILTELGLYKHFKQTMVYFIPTIATSIYTILDKTLLGIITEDAVQNGLYEQAEKVINMAKSVTFTAINYVVGVRSSYLFAEKRTDEVKSHILRSMNYIMFMGVGSLFGIIGVADTFVPVFFGEGYDGVVLLLYILSPIIIIIGISNCLGSHYYTPVGKRKESSKYLIIGSLVNLVLNCILIPCLTVYGAAIASLVAESVITIFYFRGCDGYLNIRQLSSVVSKKIIAGMIMLVGILFLKKIYVYGITSLLIQITGGVCIYVLSLLMLKDSWFVNIINGCIKKIGIKK